MSHGPSPRAPVGTIRRALELTAEGLALSAVAERLMTPPGDVARWLREWRRASDGRPVPGRAPMSPELRLIARYIGLLPGTIGDRAELLGVRRETLSRWLSEAEGTAPAQAPGRAGRRRVGNPTTAHVARLVWLLQQHAAHVVVALDDLIAVVEKP